MSMKPMKSLLCLSLASLFIAPQALAKTQIQWWHAMGGALGKKVNQIAADFNASQDEYEVKAVYKGTYPETMTGAISAFRAKEQPAIVQVFEVGTATMMGAQKAIYPVYQLMDDTQTSFDPKHYLPAVTSYYTTSDGQMLSMPFNSSTPVLYYNKDLFKKAGIDEAPKTWQQMDETIAKLNAAGTQCAFTTAWQSWTQIENFGARNDLPLSDKNNGFDGLDAKFSFNAPAFVKHIERLKAWSDKGSFKYGGRQSDSSPLLYTSECAMMMASSASLADIRENMPNTEIGVAQLPFDASVVEKPNNTIIGGASLWVLQGRPEAEYKGVAEFFSYLSSPEVQADWHQFSGYLPITQAAYELTKKQGFYEKNPGTDTAILQMTTNNYSQNSKGLRFGNFPQVRDIINEELESVWAGKKTPQQALDSAVERGNAQLVRFARTQK